MGILVTNSFNTIHRMKGFFALALIVSTISALPLLHLNTDLGLGDIPSCVTDLKSDFQYLEGAINNKDWSQVANLLKNISKSYADCKDAKNQVETCLNDGKHVISDVTDIIHAVQKKDLNPFHYVNFVKAIFNDVKTFTSECYVSLNKPSAIAIHPQDLSKCKDDLVREFTDIKNAFKNKDMSQIDDLISNFSQTFIDCQQAYNEVAACAVPAYGAIADIVGLIKHAVAKDKNPMDYIHSVENLVSHVEGVVHECFNK